MYIIDHAQQNSATNVHVHAVETAVNAV